MKKWFKVLLFSLLGFILFFMGFVGYGYYKHWAESPLDQQKYSHNVEYINPDDARLNKDFKVCNERRIAQYYNPERATYSKGKNGLRAFIMKNYVNKDYEDSGYLNIRFVINCHGKTGRYIIHENDLDLNPKKLNHDMVEQIFYLTTQLKEWNPNFIREEFRDSYMYLSYRIENGEIIEILP